MARSPTPRQSHGRAARASSDGTRPASVGEADADEADDLLLFASVECLRRVAQGLKFEPPMHVPRAVRGGAAERNSRICPEAEITEGVIHTGEFVVIRQTEPHLDWNGNP